MKDKNMAKHEIFYAVCDLFNEGEVEVNKEIANKVVEVAIELFPEFKMTCEEKTETNSIKVENFKDAK